MGVARRGGGRRAELRRWAAHLFPSLPPRPPSERLKLRVQLSGVHRSHLVNHPLDRRYVQLARADGGALEAPKARQHNFLQDGGQPLLLRKGPSVRKTSTQPAARARTSRDSARMTSESEVLIVAEFGS